ncbi:head maturation protease, ClpP-related [Riemerella anatipestifer]|uniref:ATP-dependent Clp protease proteolytic subunit n=1 Tax=Riemerella anatipestifer TaxID=34085 RepID=A0A1S7DV22_RIEAN|nr:head maturation protease, ClpP-related [Riemerella anatipestifer]AQY22982.1 ATP-dependent Clp protease proteolytic subunit [Riemerella anatipestifer]MBT0556840.1 Clp protease ClpP [Riemerella anatipestifer]MDY3351871.1 Clp protease ClpP [Riemerella anatipestifer]MDY3525054.1 Clp protease ClpP [Riemerella anatipestifer]NAV17194.1 Clp protease ClpP [Riemerella anatipestifer]
MILASQNNDLYLFGTIWDGDGVYFISKLSQMEQQYSEITLKIHSYGGSVFDGNLIANAIEKSPAKIRIEILGVAASMAGILLLSCKNVAMADNAYIMLHAPSGGTRGTASDHEKAANLLRKIELNFKKRLARRLNTTESNVSKYLEGDNWIDAEEALAIGLINEIIPAKVETIIPMEELEDKSETEVYNLYSRLLLTPAAITSNENNFNNDTMKKMLITAFALSLTEQSSDTAFVEALKDKFKDLEGNLEKEKRSKADMENQLKAYEENRIEALLEGVNASEEQKAIYRKVGATSGLDALEAILKDVTKPVAPNLSELVQNGSSGTTLTGREQWTFEQWQKEDPRGLEKLSQEDPKKFDTLFNAKYKK